jgi:hypothetical protein
VGHLVRSLGNGSVVVYLCNDNEIPHVFAGFALITDIELLLQKQVERADLFIQSDHTLGNRIKIPVDILEYNKQIAGET